MVKLFYSDLAAWWPLISPVDDYRDEAAEVLRVLDETLPQARTMLELGCGGGHNAFFLKARYALTLTDLSAEMVAQSKRLNPECEHAVGDMRTLDLGRQFDVVFVHDAIDYMATEADLAAAIAVAWNHCRPGGVALLVPDTVAERFEPGTECGGADGEDGRGVRYLEWSYELGGEGITQYAFVVRDADGSIQTVAETHRFGLFARASWERLLTAQGFAVEVVEEQCDDDRTPRLLFVARRP